MLIFLKKIVMFFLSVIMFLGLYKGGIEMKNEIAVPELNLSAEDVTNGWEVTVPFFSGNISFNRISFSYEATAAVRAVFSYRMGTKTVEEEIKIKKRLHAAERLS